MIHSPSALVVPHTVKGWEFIEIDGVICLSHKLLGANLNVNATTGLVLEQCNGFDSVDTIVKSLVERFPDYANEIKIDVLAVFARLAQEGVISFRIKQSNELLTAIRDRRANPFYYFDAIFCINLDSAKSRWHQAKNQYKLLGIEERVTRFSAVETPQNHHVGVRSLASPYHSESHGRRAPKYFSFGRRCYVRCKCSRKPLPTILAR